MTVLSEAALNLRVVDMTARFDNIGETVIQDVGAATGYRLLQWKVVAPYEGAVMGRFQYDEWYELQAAQWSMVKYAYDFLKTVRHSRLAFHAHPLLTRNWTPHVHCEPQLGTPTHSHYRFPEVTIYEALEEHQRWWASDTDLTCSALYPLET